MMSKGLDLCLQSGLEALDETLGELRQAVAILDELDRAGENTPIAPSILDRVYAQCLNAHRTLEGLVRKSRK